MIKVEKFINYLNKLDNKFYKKINLNKSKYDLIRSSEAVFELISTKKIYSNCFEFMSNDLKNNKNFILKIIKNNAEVIKYTSEDVRKDKEIVDVIVNKYIHLFKFLSNEIINNKKEIENLLFIEKKNIFPYLGKEILKECLGDKNFIDKILKSKTDLYYLANNWNHVHEDYKNNINIVYQMLSISTRLLEHISEETKNNKDIQIKALSQNSESLKYFKNIQNNDEIMLQYIEKYKSLKYVGRKYKKNKELIKKILNEVGFHHEVQYLSKELKADKEIGLMAVKQYGWNLSYLSEELKSDKEIVLEALKQDKTALKFASKEIQECCNLRNCIEMLEKMIEVEKNHENLIGKLNLTLEENKNFIKKNKI